MKRYYSLLTLLFISVGFAHAQEPNRPEFEKRVYEANDNTYVHKDLPIYLKFSTSPDPGAKVYDLKSKASAKYTNPMYLDTEGINYIRHRWAVEQSSGKTVYPKQEVLFELYADGLPPVTSSSFSGAPRYYSGGTIYYGEGLKVDLSSRDAVSGLEQIYYSLNSTSFSKYSSPITSFNEGDNSLYYFSSDNVGNAEKNRLKNFVYDVTPPTTTKEIVGIQHGSLILSPKTKIDLSSEDALSGVNRVLYNFDSGSDRKYYSPISLSTLSDGDHTLYYYSYDNVKNEESKKELKFYLDRIPPETNHGINGDLCEKRGIKWVSPRTEITLTSTDNKAGVYKTYYRIGRSMATVGSETRNDYTSPFKIPDEYGQHVVKYDAMDNVENLGNNKYLTVYMDNKAPETGIVYGKPQFFTRDTLFINKTTPVTLPSSDRGSGVTKTEYAIDGGGNKTYNGAFNIENHGHRTVTFKSTDCVNNEENQKTSKVFVDNMPPNIFHNFSIQPIDTKSGLKVYPNYTRLYLGATDRHVGTEKILYSVNGSAFTNYSSPQTLDISELNRFKQKKKYKVDVQAYDKLGNMSEYTIEFYVGRE